MLQLHLRRFLLSPQAVELFWADSPEVFLAFQDVDKRQAFTRALRKQNLPMLPITTRHGTLHPRKVPKTSNFGRLHRVRLSDMCGCARCPLIYFEVQSSMTYEENLHTLLDCTGAEGNQTHGAVATATDLEFPVHYGAQCRRRTILQRYHAVPSFSLGAIGLHIRRAGSRRPTVFQRPEQASRSPQRREEKSFRGKVRSLQSCLGPQLVLPFAASMF